MRKLWSIVLTVGLVGACGPKRTGDQDAGDDGGPCEPGTSEDCYSGASATEGVGPCHGGTRTCDSGGTWGNCEGEVAPVGEVCGNGVDDNCSGMTDEDVDNDGDGFTTCGGDCCDSTNDGCGNPELVNPGAFEAPGNMVDDDCDGLADNAVVGMCDSGLVSNSATGTDYAKAMDICQTTTDAEQTWGVIDASFVLADGTGTPNQNQRSIRPGFGGTTVQAGSAFAVLSTGSAAAPGQTAPAHSNFQTAGGIGSTSGFPGDWLAANGNNLPNAPGCPEPAAGVGANDPVMLQMRIRTPTNAKSFSFSVNFMSSEYPEWTCSAFNDFFVVLLDSTYAGSPANPTDKNLAFYTSPTMQNYPVGVNLASGNTGLFTVCTNGPIGCTAVSVPGNISTCTGTGELAGTGMDQANPPANIEAGGEVGFCAPGNNLLGGGTGWLLTAGNVVGGEIITLRIAIWDTSDGIYDSVAIVDNFQWSVDASTPGTVIE